MTVEIRRPRDAELVDYYRCLPYANGLPSWEPEPAAWHGGPEPWPPMRSPASAMQRAQWAEDAAHDAGFHPVGAFVDGQCAGASATLDFDVTMPGGRQLPMAGVTATGVIATHRRRGYLRQMMQFMFDEARGRSVPLAMLSASEGSIYGNFGFSPATHRVRWEIERSQAAFRPAPDDDGTLHLVGADEARQAWPAVHAAVRRTRVGELSPRPGRWADLSDEADGTNGPLRYLLHRDRSGIVDGIAHYRLPWSASSDFAGTLIVESLEAVTPQAYRALWQLLLDFDLTKRVVAPGRPRDEPLRWMLTNARALRITRQSDNLWARILNVPSVLATRAYPFAAEFVIEIPEDTMVPTNVGRWQLSYDGQSATCERTPHSPDLVIGIAALSSLAMGGLSVSDFVAAGLIDEVAAGSASRFATLLRVDPEPHNSFGF